MPELNIKIAKIILLISLIYVTLYPNYCFSDSGSCKFYAYIDYGIAMVGGNINVTAKVYRVSQIIKANTPVFASCNLYHSTTCGNHHIKNIGPYDTELVCYMEVNKFISELKTQGYIEKLSEHTLPAFLVDEYESCD